jgi:SAM-dependent methyltransferase
MLLPLLDMPSRNNPARLYSEFASWFHLLSAPADYAEEAEFARKTLVEASTRPIQTVLELGSGGGNNASHLKRSFKMTLVDLSSGMLDLSREINPQCEHFVGDMTSIRLGSEFDAVFVHDAVMYLTTAEQLKECLRTAFVHCKPGGTALFMPDFVKETFVPGVHHGGHDGNSRGLRHYEWTFDPDPADSTYTVDFVYMLREGNSAVRVESECHVFGLFSRDEWLRELAEVGFDARSVVDPYGREVFVCTK